MFMLGGVYSGHLQFVNSPEKAKAIVTANGRPSGTATTRTVTPMITNLIMYFPRDRETVPKLVGK